MLTRVACAAIDREWPRHFAAGLWTATTLTAAVVVSRGLGGHLEQGIHPALATSVAALLTGLNMLAAVLLNSAVGCVKHTLPMRERRVTHALPVLLMTFVPPFALGVSLLPASSVAGVTALSALSLLGTLALLLAGEAICLPHVAEERGRGRDGTMEPPREDEPFPFDDSELILENEPDEAEQAISQSMSRRTEPDGGESIEGIFTLHFVAGEQIAVVHLPFCPPLTCRPEISCHLLDDRPIRLRVTAVHPYGARVEAKRIGETEGEDEAVVGYVVTAGLPQSRAA